MRVFNDGNDTHDDAFDFGQEKTKILTEATHFSFLVFLVVGKISTKTQHKIYQPSRHQKTKGHI